MRDIKIKGNSGKTSHMNEKEKENQSKLKFNPLPTAENELKIKDSKFD